MSNSINDKERGFKPISMENFSTSYTYNAVGAPLTLKRQGVIAPASEDGSTGYSLSARGGTGSYKWNSAGLLNADSARGIRKTYYNESGQPTSIEFTDKGHLDYTYSTSGELIRVSTYAMLPGGSRATLVSERSYCGGFVFEGDSLIYANFPGGYFDGEGLAHYSHTDFQGNITMVTDRDGQICQHTGYYPYGEPWREPAGQPYLYGGKERMRDGSLNDYDFSARRLNSALALWTAPDPMARDFSSINPYVYCASNPIRYIDPTGKAHIYVADKKGCLTCVGSDGKNDKQNVIVSENLGNKISKLTKEGLNYAGEIENNHEMAILPTPEDLLIIIPEIDRANQSCVEVGGSKGEDGTFYKWVDGDSNIVSEIDEEGNIINKHSIELFKYNKNSTKTTVPLANRSKFYYHIHPTHPTLKDFGSSTPSRKDRAKDIKFRKENDYKGATFVVGGKDSKVTFYYQNKTISNFNIYSLLLILIFNK